MPFRIKLFVTLCACAAAGAASAHPAEQALVLLLPTDLYTFGGTAAVAASILLTGLLSGARLRGVFTPAVLGSLRAKGSLQTGTSLLSTAALLGLIYIGAFGPRDPQANLLPLVIWTGWWIGVFALQGLVADVWAWINPWTGLARLMNPKGAPVLTLPDRWRAWPAVLVFAAFHIFLLADIAPSDPGRLARIVLSYWLVTLIGTSLFGRDVWLTRVECFSVLFALIGLLRCVALDRDSGQIKAGVPGWAAIGARMDVSRAVFCLMILISGSFDGLKETFWWLGQIGVNPLEFPGRSAVVAPSVLGLLGANLGLISVYALCVAVGLWCLRRFGTPQHAMKPPRFSSAFCIFALSILPLALGYHIAHYPVSFLVQSQYLAATLGDPLARGANLLGLSGMRVTTGFLNTPDTVRLILLTNVGAVVTSHIVSVLMAHTLAGTLVTGRRNLVLIQIGLSALMIAYTLFGLWLLSTPRGA